MGNWERFAPIHDRRAAEITEDIECYVALACFDETSREFVWVARRPG